MTHTPHALAADFPEFADRLSSLKASDAHLGRLADEYHALNRAVHRAETLVEPVDPAVETDMRKRRAALKDAIYARLRAEAV